jgi:hypothetical protein
MKSLKMLCYILGVMLFISLISIALYIYMIDVVNTVRGI